MTTFYDFQPSTQQVSSFQVTLDEVQYVLTVPWNLFGQRYYLTCADLEGNRVFTLPMVGSPDGLLLQTASWLQGKVTLQTQLPHGYRPGTTVRLTLGQMVPEAYNGTYDFLITGGDTLTYNLAADPGVNTSPGILYDNINLAGGYFETSTLVFRTSSSQLEITP